MNTLVGFYPRATMDDTHATHTKRGLVEGRPHRAMQNPFLTGPSTISLRKNYVSTRELHWSACLGQQEDTTQDAQKGRPARPQRAKTGGVPSGVR